MKKPMSDMTATQFVECVAALGVRYGELAIQLGKHHSTVSQYSTGRKRIPADVAANLNRLVIKRAAYLAELAGRAQASTDIGHMIVETNEIKQKREREAGTLHSAELTLGRRRREHDRRTLPPYEMHPERFAIFLRCLKAWKDEVTVRLQKRLTDPSRIQQHQLELADLRCIVSLLPKRMPYAVCLTFTEWDVVSRALRWGEIHKIESARALYQHWRRHKGVGYPVSKARDIARIARAQEAA